MILKALTAVFIFLALSFPGKADDYITDRVGGQGGGPEIRVYCTEDRLLLGVDGHFGAWLDNFMIWCGYPGSDIRQLVRTNLGNNKVTRHTDVLCPLDRAVAGVITNTVEFEGTHILNKMRLVCRRVEPPINTRNGDIFGVDDGDLATQQFSTCPGNRVAHGVSVRYGLYIDSFALICR